MYVFRSGSFLTCNDFRCRYNIPEPECPTNILDIVESDAYCGIMTKPMGPFKNCIQAAAGTDVIELIQFECTYDACANWGNLTAVIEVWCNALAKLVAACRELQITDISLPNQCIRKLTVNPSICGIGVGRFRILGGGKV